MKGAMKGMAIMGILDMRHMSPDKIFVYSKENAMPMSRAEMDQVVDEHFVFEARDDVAGVLDTLSDDATHDVVGWQSGPSEGREAARPFYETMFADLADGQVTTIRRLYGEDFVVDESLWEGRAVGSPFGCEGRNRQLSFRLLHIFEFKDDGRIQRENVWLDMTAIQQQLD
jgi:predicted ester cyclase